MNKNLVQSNNQSQQEKKAEKKQQGEYQCLAEGCNKCYQTYASLYTHIKLKHPNSPKMLIPVKQRIPGGEIVQGQKQYDIDLTVVYSIYNNPVFLKFFEELKLQEQEANLKDIFLSEKYDCTRLTKEFLKQHAQKSLVVSLQKSIEYYKSNLEQSSSSTANINMDKSLKSVGNFLERSQHGMMQQSLMRDSFASNASQGEDLGYYSTYYLICREMIKCFSTDFALEICYLFDKMIEIAPTLKNHSVQIYVDKSFEQLNEFVSENESVFKGLQRFQNDEQNTLLLRLVNVVAAIIAPK